MRGLARIASMAGTGGLCVATGSKMLVCQQGSSDHVCNMCASVVSWRRMSSMWTRLMSFTLCEKVASLRIESLFVGISWSSCVLHKR